MLIHLIRHAHAGQGGPGGRDIYRPLSERGLAEANALATMVEGTAPVLSSPATRCVQTVEALATRYHKPVVLEALAPGASGYLLKADGLDAILRGIDEVLSGGAPLNSHIARMILTTFNAIRPVTPDIDLTERERETLSLLVKGLIKKEIADQLGVTYHTVDTHVRNIYGKLQVHNLSGAVAKAIQLGLI